MVHRYWQGFKRFVAGFLFPTHVGIISQRQGVLMYRPKVLITRNLPQEALSLIEECCKGEMNKDASFVPTLVGTSEKEDRSLSEAGLKARIIGKDGLVCLL